VCVVVEVPEVVVPLVLLVPVIPVPLVSVLVMPVPVVPVAIVSVDIVSVDIVVVPLLPVSVAMVAEVSLLVMDVSVALMFSSFLQPTANRRTRASAEKIARVFFMHSSPVLNFQTGPNRSITP
jgi:hypothetical protein